MKNINHDIRKKMNLVIYHFSRYMEVAISVLILVVVVISGVQLVCSLLSMDLSEMNIDFFSQFLSKGLTLVVGIEFVNMLCRHSVQSVIEVLLFAIARQIIVEHLNTLEILIGIISIAGLFAIRKYLFIKDDDKKITG